MILQFTYLSVGILLLFWLQYRKLGKAMRLNSIEAEKKNIALMALGSLLAFAVVALPASALIGLIATLFMGETFSTLYVQYGPSIFFAITGLLVLFR
ncbi:hypothetical protein E1162_10360 [Rhodobacteraceae bacterium RKSG542]|uniref:hypothetical protein n=1 Tax=Pseudovibrio flavus TaxID=2529854 RepID=UPI0012BD55D1|nr:hypothetical protein [Pseudovibrio flavus]MTI17642.1 hypothetical protein [Pseudovibrio flavus]